MAQIQRFSWTFQRRLVSKSERFLSSVPRSRRTEVPEKKSWFRSSEKVDKVLQEGQATGKQIRNALGIAAGIQISVVVASMTMEAISEKSGNPIPAEIPSTISFIGFIGSGIAFRKYLQPSWAKKRWYFLLPPMALSSIIFSAFFVRSVLIPEEPPLSEKEAAEIKVISNALNLKAFDGSTPLSLEACTMAWGKLFARISNENGQMTIKSVQECDVNDPVVRACGVEHLISYLQQPQNMFALQGVFNVVCAGKPFVGMKEFTMLMLASESAFEGNSDHQCELLYRLMNTNGKGQLTESEFLSWLNLMMENETSAASFDDALIRDRKGWIYGSTVVRLTPTELVQDYFKQYDTKRKGYLSFSEFKNLCNESNIRFAIRISLAHLVMDASPTQMAGQLLQFLMLNPSAGIYVKSPDTDVVTK